ncbi:MAG: NAD(P)H-dependent oxidoreductase [Anaerolineales bacterium]
MDKYKHRYVTRKEEQKNNMSVSVILAHPRKGSFNHAIAATCVKVLEGNGHMVNFHDLYAEGFESVLPFDEFDRDIALPSEIEAHCEEISAAKGIVIVHPNWWGQPPAILKGWIDRVIRPGVAYEFVQGDKGEGVPRGLLNADSAIVFNTSNTNAERERTVFGDPLELIWKNCIFDLCGVREFFRTTFSIIVTSTDKERRLWLTEVAEIIGERYPKKSHNQAF